MMKGLALHGEVTQAPLKAQAHSRILSVEDIQILS